MRLRYEPRLGSRLDAVRVHADAPADAAARAADARAFTLGRDVFFRAGQYAPRTPQGERLLAHELAHTLQPQPAGRVRLRRQGMGDMRLAEKRMEEEAQAREAAIPEADRIEAGLVALGVVLHTVAAPDAQFLRTMYNEGAARIAAERARLLAAGLPEEAVARQLSDMRHRLALEVRQAGSSLYRKGAELFDAVRGNNGRPTYEALRQAGKTNAQIIETASRTNGFINRLPGNLRVGAGGLWLLSGGMALYVVYDAPPERRGEVARQEAANLAGTAMGALALEGICIATGIATEGFGLIVCGLLGGALGHDLVNEQRLLEALDIAPHPVPDQAGRFFRIEGDFDTSDFLLFSIVHRRVEAAENVLVIATGMRSGQMVSGRGHYHSLEVVAANDAATALLGRDARWVPAHLLRPAQPSDLAR